MSVRFGAFVFCILGLSSAFASAAETTFVNKDSVFAVFLTSTENEKGDAQRLFELVTPPRKHQKIIEGDNFKLECSVEIVRCQGCNKYTCMMAIQPSQKAYIHRDGIEDALVGDDAKVLYGALKTRAVEDNRRPGVFTKEFISLDNHTFRISAHHVTGPQSDLGSYVVQVMMQK